MGREGRRKRTVWESQGPASEDLVKAFVDLKPPWKNAEDEKEESEAEEHERRRDAADIPDLPGMFCKHTMGR